MDIMAAARGARSTGSLKRAVSAHRPSPGRPCNLPAMADDIPTETTDGAHLISVVPASEVAQRSSPDLADGLQSLDDETADPKPSAGVVAPKGKGKRSILASPLKVAPKASAPAAAKDDESLTSSFQAKAFHHPVKKHNAFAETNSKWIIGAQHQRTSLSSSLASKSDERTAILSRQSDVLQLLLAHRPAFRQTHGTQSLCRAGT